MLYGRIRKDHSLIVVAGDNIADFKKFVSAHGQSPSDEEMLLDSELTHFEECYPTIIEFSSDAEAERFAAKHDIELMKPNALKHQFDMMIREHKSDPYFRTDQNRLTIAELYNIHEEDPWDKRADEVKADEKLDKVYSPPVQEETEEDIIIKSANVFIGQDGHISANAHVLKPGERKKEELDDASKKEAEELLAGIFGGDVAEPDDVEDETIEEDSKFAQFFKVAVIGRKLTEVHKHLTEEQKESVYIQNNNAAGCWMAFIRQHSAETVEETLKNEGFFADSFAVDEKGNRIIENGTNANVMDENPEWEKFVRPWNDPEKWENLSDEKKEAIRFSPDEFFYHIEKGRNRFLVYIVPRSYFNEHGTMYEGDLGLKKMLPTYFKDTGDNNVFEATAEKSGIQKDMGNRGFFENLLFTAYIISL